MAEWNFACPDWKDRLKHGRSLVPDLPLDRELASRAVAIFNKLRLPDVPGRPALRDAAGDWQRDLVAALFGSLDRRTGRRRVRKLLNLIPKKNNKTTGSAAIMLAALLMDNEPRQNYSLLGATQKIADRGFEQAEGMIRADPELAKRFHVRGHVKTIVDQKTESTLKVMTFDEKVVTGDIPKGMLVDELHILGKVHAAERVWGQLMGGLVARPGGFMVAITTQSDEPPAGVFAAELKLARAIRDGKVTGAAATTLPVLYEFPEEFQADPDQPWRDPACWPMVLPNLGRSVFIDLLQEGWAEAQAKGRAEERRWASQHLNVQISTSLFAEQWNGAAMWDGGVEPGLTLDALLERCEVVVAGIDGGGLDDLFGLAVLGRERETGRWLTWFHAYAADKVLDLRKDVAPALLDFVADGDLTLFARAQELTDAVVAVLKRVRDSGKFPARLAIGIDPQTITVVIDALRREGFADYDETKDRGPLTRVPQGWQLSSAVWALEFKLFDQALVHGGSRMMNWCVGNARVEQRGNAVFVSKAASGKAKIDPLVALFNAARLMDYDPVAEGAKGAAVNDWLTSLRSAA